MQASLQALLCQVSAQVPLPLRPLQQAQQALQSAQQPQAPQQLPHLKQAPRWPLQAPLLPLQVSATLPVLAVIFCWHHAHPWAACRGCSNHGSALLSHL